jgi:murein DD-endopeptidase MepM/ murein hydrolase activator NlpD
VKPYTGGVRHDYKDALDARPATAGRRWSWFVLGISLPLAAVTLLLISSPNESKVPPTAELSPERAEDVAESGTALVLFAAADGPLSIDALEAARRDARTEELSLPEHARTELTHSTVQLVVNRGDTLDLLFRRNGLSISDLAAMVRLEEAGRHLRLLRPGDEIQIAHEEGRILSLLREIDAVSMLEIARTDSGFEAQTIEREVEMRTTGAHGVIQTSLFGAGQAAGISDAVLVDMAGIFQWDIDFIKDVRVGDEFTVIYEELWRDGEKLRDGVIVAAEFLNRGTTYRAARYVAGDGERADYFTPEGRNVRRAFLRAPVHFTRISSNFDPNRRHPVLNTIRAHRGVDYAAPTGTPIMAAGDGRVAFRGQRGGYGNTVVIEHGGNITTLYAHMSRFGNQRVGGRVRQGDIIGYVGMTGLATGPHLHYEYQVNGVHRNPRTVPLPAADPISEEYRADFEASAEALWQQLDEYRPDTRLAAASD